MQNPVVGFKICSFKFTGKENNSQSNYTMFRFRGTIFNLKKGRIDYNACFLHGCLKGEKLNYLTP